MSDVYADGSRELYARFHGVVAVVLQNRSSQTTAEQVARIEGAMIELEQKHVELRQKLGLED